MDDQFFGEWVYYYNEEERVEALEYLRLWKKFFLRRVPTLEFIQDQLIDKPQQDGVYTLGIKIQMKGKKPENVFSLSNLASN